MINKYWVIYGLKLCLLIYYRNELFNWYQIGPNEVDSCSQELVVYIHTVLDRIYKHILYYVNRTKSNFIYFTSRDWMNSYLL